MAQGNIQVKFEAVGDKALILAINNLSEATKNLTSNQAKAAEQSKKAAIQSSKLNQRTLTLTARLTAQNKTWKQLGVSTATVSKAMQGNRVAIEKLNMAYKKSTVTTRILGGAISVVRSKLLVYSFAFGLVSRAVSVLNKEVSEFQVAQGKLKGVLTSTGFAAGKTSKSLEDMANKLQATMGVSNTAIMEMQGRLLTFTNVVGKQFDDAIKLGLDMSNVLGTDLNSATIQLGKALNEPVSGVTALTRVGVSFTQQQKDQIKALQDSGNIIGAQKVILNELRVQFGGATAAINENATSTFALKKLQGEFGDALREAGFAADGLITTLIGLGRIITWVGQNTFGAVNAVTEWASIFLQTGKIFQDSIKDELKFIEVTGAASTAVRRFDVSFRGYSDAVQEAAKQNKDFVATNDLNKYIAEIEDASKSEEERIEILGKLSEAILQNKYILQNQAQILAQEEIKAEEEAIKARKQLQEDFSSFVMEQSQERIDAIRSDLNQEIELIRASKNDELNLLRESTRYKLSSDKKKAEMEKEIINDKAAAEEAARKRASEDAEKYFYYQQALKATETLMSAWAGAALVVSQKGIFGLPLAALIKAQGVVSAGLIMAQKPPKFQYGGLVGGERHAQGGTMIEAEQGEYVMSRRAVKSMGVEAMNRINRGGGGGSVNISFSGNVLSKDFIEDEAIPQIKEALRMGGDIGVG
tara:strand:+ start:2331 stop:4430 length:2100 start_codon:yes stop_codon:yes gene_type:complete